MPNIGPLEIGIILVIVLVIFGPKKLPELGKSLGRGINEFKGTIDASKVDAGKVDAEKDEKTSA